MRTEPLYSLSDINEILPHRSPFLFVTRVIEMEPGKRIIAEKDLLAEECYFSGHFPGNPVMPGVLISEALAQTSGLLIGFSRKETDKNQGKRKKDVFLLGNVNIKFTSTARPGQRLRLEAVLKKCYGKLFLFDVQASVTDMVIAKGTLTLAKDE